MGAALRRPVGKFVVNGQEEGSGAEGTQGEKTLEVSFWKD